MKMDLENENVALRFLCVVRKAILTEALMDVVKLQKNKIGLEEKVKGVTQELTHELMLHKWSAMNV